MKKDNLYNFNKDINKADKKGKKKKIDNNKIESENEIIIGVTKFPEKNKSKNVNKNTNTNKKNVVKQKSNKPKNIKNKTKDKKLNKKIKYMVIIFLFIALLAMLLLSPLFNISTIEVKGNNKVFSTIIENLSEVNKGENIFRISKNEIKKKIKRNGYIESVKIYRELPDKLCINVTEREATFILKVGNGYAYINNQGYILEIAQEKIEVPMIIGNDEEYSLVDAKRLNEKDLKKLGMVLKIVKIAQINDINGIITTIDIKDENDYKVYFESEQKTAYLGDCSNLETKMLFVVSMLKNESGKSGEIFVNMDLNKDNAFFRESV